MVGSDPHKLGIVVRIAYITAFEVLQRRIVVGRLKFAKTKKCPRTWCVRRKSQNFLQSRNSFPKLSRVVEQHTDIPPALGPVGFEFERSTIEGNRLRWTGRIAGCGRGLCERVEIARRVLLSAGRLPNGGEQKENSGRQKIFGGFCHDVAQRIRD